MKTSKAILLADGKIMPAGTELTFADGCADYNGTAVSLAQLPYEACEYQMNETLHPAAWQDDAMIPEVRERLLQIANDFYEQSGFDAPIQDIILTGSMANYNYHDKSDFDVHIVINYADVDANTELVKNAANAIKWKWNEQHNITIAGHDVELYIQDASEPHTASGVYSLMNDTWLVKPTFRTINTSDSDVAAKASAISAQATVLEQNIVNATDEELPGLLEQVDELRYRALRLRKDSFEQGEDEFSVGNLAFKQLRNDGTIGKLLQLENDIYDRINSMS